MTIKQGLGSDFQKVLNKSTLQIIGVARAQFVHTHKTVWQKCISEKRPQASQLWAEEKMLTVHWGGNI